MPGLLCSLKGHRAEARVIRNRGQAFSRCARCGADLVEVDGEWRTPPKGARIVWKPAGEAPDTAPAAEVEPDRREAEDDGDRRRSGDRRKARGPLPAYLRGKDRRSGARDRRRAFGRRFRGE